MLSTRILHGAVALFLAVAASVSSAQVDSTGVAPLTGSPSVDCTSPWAAAMCKSVKDQVTPLIPAPIAMQSCPNGTYVTVGTDCGALAAASTPAVPSGSYCGYYPEWEGPVIGCPGAREGWPRGNTSCPSGYSLRPVGISSYRDSYDTTAAQSIYSCLKL